MTARELIKRLPGAVPLVRWAARIRGGRPKHCIVDWGYQQVDWEIVDYKLYRLPGFPGDLRGPAPQQLLPGGYIACVGAAQTFGRFCQDPFPYQLSQRLGIPVLNLGIAGAGPRFFLRHPRLIQWMNDSRLVIVQVMSARSEDNSVFESGGLEFLTIRSTGKRIGANAAYRRLLESGDIQLVRSIIAETRANWVASYEQLLSRMRVPTLLFWFSTREPEYLETHDHVKGLLGKFPHLVNREMAQIVRSHCDAYVHCVTDKGLPQRLTSRFSGRPVRVHRRPDLGRGMQTENRYYPWPEMHRHAADLLEPACRAFLHGLKWRISVTRCSMLKLVTSRRTQQAPDPIIVFGSPRSGTSYLNRLLNEHPDVYITEEARLFVWMHHSLNLLGDRRFVRKHRENFIEHVRTSYPDLIRSFYRTIKPTARYWGDKNPHYAAPENQGCLEAITELFPGARFIHIIRDGRDVVISLLRKGWTSFDEAHDIWMKHVDIGSRFGAQAPGRYLEIRYEDMVYDDVAAARRLFGFLGIEMHKRVLKFCQRQQRRRTPFKSPTRDLQGGVTTSDWGRLLPPDQRLRSLELIGSHLVQLGYESEASLKDAKEGLSRECASARVHPIRAVVRQVVPASATVIVVSDNDDELLLAMDGRRAWHFPQREGGHNMAIRLDAVGTEAIAMLEALQARGGDFLLVPSVAFQWLEQREDFRRHIDAHHRRIWANDLCLIYELGRWATPRATGPGVAN